MAAAKDQDTYLRFRGFARAKVYVLWNRIGKMSTLEKLAFDEAIEKYTEVTKAQKEFDKC